MAWKLEEAQRNFPKLLNAAIEEPQLIYKQDQLVAAVIEPETLQKFLDWQQQQKQSLADAFAELYQLCEEENYLLEVPPRQDRSNVFAENLYDTFM
ncbi:MAG: prevent-host-death protein [Leptolyngbyaceae cyanobacterium SM1_4_3]|nr:prevent-host-death protein [Leptolyngbyaceae cyanobacterium SM1_4_3]